MSVLIGILVSAILGVVPVPEPFKTILWVVVVIVAVFAFLQISGIYHFSLPR